MLDIWFQDKYSDIGNFQFSEVRDPRLKKTLPYYVQKASAIYTPYINNFCSIPYASIGEFWLLRQYSDDDQPEETYKKYLRRFLNDPDTKKIGTHIDIIEAEKKSYYNVSYEVVSKAKKIKDTLIGLFESKEFKISADPIDLHSKTLVEDAEMEMWALVENKEFLHAYNAMAGLQNQDPAFVPESQDEMDVYKETGGFKPNYAKAMEKAIKYTRDISNWGEIKKLMAADKLTTNYECCRDYYDPEDCMVKTRYVDPCSLIIQWSEFPDHHDSNYAGHLYTMNISEVRQWLPDRPEKFYRDLALMYCGYSGNPMQNAFHLYDNTNNFGVYGYEFFKVLILDAEWIDVDSKHELIYKNKWGNEASKEIEFDTDIKTFTHLKEEDKTERFTDKRRRFACKWIVGTGEMLEWGPSYDVVRPSKRDVSLTFHVYRHGDRGRKSLFKRLKPLLDNYQILWLKFQNSIAYLRNAGGLVNATAIMSLAKTKEERAEWMKGWLESGWGFFSETNAMQMKNTSMQPFYPDAGGAGKMMEDIRMGYLVNSQMIEEITGYSPLAFGQTPKGEEPVTTSMASLNAMSNTLRPYISGYMTLCKEHAESVSRWIQLAIKNNPYARKAYEKALGEMDVQLLKTAEGDGVQYGIVLQALPDDIQKQSIMKRIETGTQPDQNGDCKLNDADAIILTGMLESQQPLKNIGFEMAMRIKKNVREQQARKKALMQQQSQLNQQDSAASAKNAQDTADKIHKHKMDEISAQNQGLAQGKVATEGVRQSGNIQVAKIKTDGKKDEKPEPATAQ
jgi:hypothetical protein